MKRYTLKEAAQEKEIKLFDLVKAMNDGDLAHTKEGNNIYIDESALDSYLGMEGPIEEKAEEEREERGREQLEAVVDQKEETTPDKKAEEVIEIEVEREIPPWEKLARETFENYDAIISKFGESQVRKVTENLTAYLGEDGTKKILRDDREEELLNLDETNFVHYFSNLNPFLRQIQNAFGDSVPMKYDFRRSPENFLPGVVKKTRSQLTDEIRGILQEEKREESKKRKAEKAMIKKKEKEAARAEEKAELNPRWKEIGELLLKKNYADLAQQYTPERVGHAVVALYDSLGEEKATTILDAIKNPKNFYDRKPETFDRYVEKLANILQKIEEEFEDEIPEEYDLEKNTEGFLPARITPLEKKFIKELKGNGHGNGSKAATVKEICQRTGYSEDLVTGLQAEGFNVYYLDALLKEGLDIAKTAASGFIGGKDLPGQHWHRNGKRALSTLGVSYDKRIWKEQEKILRQMDLIQASGGKKHCLSLNKKWADVTDRTPYLKEYLKLYLAPEEKEE